MPNGRELRIAHVPLNTPANRKLVAPGRFRPCNDDGHPGGIAIPSNVSVQWLLQRLEDAAVRDAFDVLHIHFGLEDAPVASLAAVCAAMRSAGKPVVYTCHELESVHGMDQAHYSAALRCLIAHATAVTVMTEAAKCALVARFPESATRVHVVPHGYVLPPNSPLFGSATRRTGAPAMLSFGSFRENRELLATSINTLFVARSVNAHFTVATKPIAGRRANAATLACLSMVDNAPNADLLMQSQYSDQEVAQLFAGADFVLLPYRTAGHSGQLALALDVGAIPVLTDVGFLKPQYAESITGIRHAPPALFVPWSDAPEWARQQRFANVLTDACVRVAQLRYTASLALAEWRVRRYEEHASVLAALDTVYRQGMQR